MTGDKRREPLWASSLAEQPQPEVEVPRPAPVEAEEAPAPPRPQRRVVRTAALAALTLVALAVALADDGWLRVEDVPSYWGDIPMTCHTMRLEQDERALEWFRCHAVRGGVLPPGAYRSPGSQWTSDLTRLDARANVMEIARDGELTGWAVY